MIEFAQDLYLALKSLRILDILFGNDLNDSVFVGGLNHSPEIYNTIGATSEGLD
jgi:hypothetical protein